MNAKTQIKKYNSFIRFFGGIAICLLSVILIMNIGMPARILSFPFYFLFGIASYISYVMIYIFGFVIILREKKFRIKYIRNVVALFLIFIGSLILVSFISSTTQGINLTLQGTQSDVDVNFIDFVSTKFEEAKYFESEFIYLFNLENSIGGGFIGAFINALITDFIGEWFGYVISILLILGGACLSIIPFAVRLKKASNRRKKEKEATTLLKEINNEQVTSDSSYFEPEYEEEDIEEAALPQNDKQRTLYNDYIYEKTGVFTRTKFPHSNNAEVNDPVKPVGKLHAGQFRHSSFFNEEVVPAPIINNHVEEEVSKEEIFEVKPIIHEQMTLDFDADEVEEIQTTYQENLDEFNDEPELISETLEEEIILETTPINEIDNIPVTNDIKEEVSESTPRTEEKSVFKARLNLPFTSPSITLLEDLSVEDTILENEKLAQERVEILNTAFEDLKVGAYCDGYIIGPTVTRFNIRYHKGVSVRNLANKVEDLCILLGGVGARFAPIVAGETFSGLEVPNAQIASVSFKEVYEKLPDANKYPLSVPFGKNIAGETIFANFNEFPHLLVAGTTGSGKSVYIHSIIMSLIMRNSPDDLKFVLVDPKQVEMNMYVDMPHLLCPVINEAENAKDVFVKLTEEMDYRFSLFKDASVLSLKEYNRWAEANNKEKLPYIIAVIDEYADLVEVCKEVSSPIVRLTGKARASGIHILIATQRPSTNVITGVIKGNLPTHVALMTATTQDSVVILSEGGAETLLGKGDMLVQSPLVSRVGCVRIQSPYVQSCEIERVVSDIKKQYPVNYDPDYINIIDKAKATAESSNFDGSLGAPYSKDGMSPDEILYHDIVEWVMTQDYCSMSKIQRTFQVGFNRAGKLMDRLKEEGIVAQNPDSPSSAKGCRVLLREKFYGEVEVLEDHTVSQNVIKDDLDF